MSSTPPDSYGIAIERGLRELSGQVGVADFVFKPVNISKGSGAQREIGDFLLWVGSVMAIVSVKSRAPDVMTGHPDRERKWLLKTVESANKQIKGVARTLTGLQPGAISLVSERGIVIPWDPQLVDQYLGVIVIHAPEPEEELAPPVMDGPVPTIVMLAEDWDFLHQVLPSTTAVLNYVARRASVVPACPLGSEPDLLGLIVEQASDRNFTFPDEGLPRGYFHDVADAHPEWFLATDPDGRFAFVVDAMIEAASDADPAWSVLRDPLDYLHITTFLDRIPLALRVSVGKNVVQRCESVGNVGGYNVGLFGLPHGLLLVMSGDMERAERSEFLQGLTTARHSQALEAGAPPNLVTLGIATEPLPSKGRSHDLILVDGSFPLDNRARAARDAAFPPIDLAHFVDSWRNSLMPR